MYDVLVVGGGVSGITCAQQLFKNGYNFRIIEAKTSLGGRTSTVMLSKGEKPLFFNKGAAWIHGPVNNPLVPLMEKYKIHTVQNCGQVGFLDHLYFPGSYELSDQEREEVERLLSNLKNQFLEIKNIEKGTSAQDILHEILNSSPTISDQYYSKTRVGYALQWLIHQIGQYESSSLEQISSKNFSFDLGNQVADKGIDQIVVTYEELIKNMVKELPNNCVILSDPVIKIDYTNQNFVNVTTISGKKFQSKKVVITCSLGVLKSNKIQFNPPLPSKKQQAIKNIGFGMMNKVFLQFSDCFWDPNCHSFGIISEPIQIPYWLNHLSICKENVLVGFYAGEFPLQTQQENWSDEQILNCALELLHSCFPSCNIKDKLIDYYITRWENDEWILGSYSYFHKNCTLDDFDHMAAPVDNKLYFAGEHTSKEETGYVHGAFESGLQAAQLIHNEFSTSKEYSSIKSKL